MPSITGQQLLAFAAQYQEMGKELDRKNRENPNPDLRLAADNLLSASLDLSSSAILATLDDLAPHYDAMLSIVRDLKREAAFAQHLTRVLAFADAALAIASAALQGNPIAVVAAVANAASLLP